MRLLSRRARRLYGLDEIDDASPTSLRELAHRINLARSAAARGDTIVHAGEIGALSLLQDLIAEELEALKRDVPDVLERALLRLDEELGREAVDALLDALLEEFDLAGTSLDVATGTSSNEGRLAAIEALLLLRQVNRNPALESLRELFDDRRLPADVYAAATRILESDPGGSEAAGGLVDRLEATPGPAPGSIVEQLSAWLDRRDSLPAPARRRLERAIDALTEERARGPAGAGPPEIPEAADLGSFLPSPLPRAEPSWMHELTLLAKQTHVWLDQLSRRLGRSIRRLDEVPESELARLANQGIRGLWLIGVWERSPASERIKRLTGDATARASAYSIFEYRAAAELGGDSALEELRDRALRHGIRLVVDVVPNHFGLDSPWVREHPERFLSVERCPFPTYTFHGPDLSPDPDVGIFLEDHYYDRSDAAVVFRHVDRRSGVERFVYHGNDGTSTPWNDTAQLDYSRQDVRRAMTEEILALTGRFHILRFDAAMTLTRLHFQRLWFPPPGGGGAIPSRSEHGWSSRRFERAMPGEFWRDVVERVEKEHPDTLLIAEAFWLMEPYFIRELGMHRVYNSAFMHLLRERDNERFQRLLRDSAERDPELLRRSVNFMSTPDEATAAEQFGNGDRHFAVCTLLATLPGTPLFAHGQMEGLAEKYGMEYERARSGESVDPQTMARYEREIEPLLGLRDRFADLDELHLLDVVDVEGDRLPVHALCHGRGPDLLLILVNNSEHPVRGRLGRAHPVRRSESPARALDFATLLGSPAADAGRIDLLDPRTERRLSAPLSEIGTQGLAVELAPYEALVLRRD